MKKYMILASAVLFSLTMASGALAAAGDYSQPGANASEKAGKLVTVDASGVAGANNITFKPSSGVIIAGKSFATNFIHGGYHLQADGKDAGQAYAMNGTSSYVYFAKLKDSDAAQGSTLTTSLSGAVDAAAAETILEGTGGTPSTTWFPM